MPDLLTHALLAYVVCRVLSWRYDWLDSGYVTVGMAGAFIPDIAKIGLLVPSARVAARFDVPFSWLGIHTLGGTAIAVLIGGVLAAREHRRRVLGLLAIGGATHLLVDAFLLKATGRAYPLLWPVTATNPRTPGLYLSTDIWPVIVVGAIAVLVWRLDARKAASTTAD